MRDTIPVTNHKKLSRPFIYTTWNPKIHSRKDKCRCKSHSDHKSRCCHLLAHPFLLLYFSISYNTSTEHCYNCGNILQVGACWWITSIPIINLPAGKDTTIGTREPLIQLILCHLNYEIHENRKDTLTILFPWIIRKVRKMLLLVRVK